MHQEYIEIRGARENNLKNVSLRIPQDHDLQNDVSHLSTITFHPFDENRMITSSHMFWANA
jgi:hypothetical protein